MIPVRMRALVEAVLGLCQGDGPETAGKVIEHAFTIR
jgi:hypothetical protein